MSIEKIEPHVILHLKLQKKDIEEYMKSKIIVSNNDTINSNNTIECSENVSYTVDNTTIFSSFESKEPCPSNSNSIHYNVSSIPDNIQNSTRNKTPSSPFPKNNIEETFYRNYSLDISHVQVSDEKMECKKENHIFETMKEFSNANKNNTWPSSTNIWCFWCCHSFTTPPVAIPLSYTNKTFHVTGCYCSFECSVSHLFSNNIIHENEKWNSYNLLHILRKKLIKENIFEKIEFAPPKETLQVFGGNMTIEEFRNSYTNTRQYNILHPPMISLIPTIEIVEKSYSALLDSNIHQKDASISLDEKRVEKASQNIKLKRKEPLIDKKKTLLHYMNLKFQKNE